MRLKFYSIGAYAALIVAAAGLFYFISSAGESLVATAPAGAIRFGATTVRQSGGVLMHVLLALVVIILSARALGSLFRRIHQPQVIGEMIAGILLGPSFLGHFAPAASAYILPNEIATYLSVIAQIGVILYMFLVGVELDTDLLRPPQPRLSCHLTCQHRRAVPAGRGACPVALPAVGDAGCSLHLVCLVHGRRHVDHGVSRVGPHSYRPSRAQDPHGHHCPGLCGGWMMLRLGACSRLS
jgi:hypothetical protein